MPKIRNISPVTSKLVIDMKALLEEFLLIKEADGLAPRTLKDYRYHIEKFIEFLGLNYPTYQQIRIALLKYLSASSSFSVNSF